MKAMVEPVVEFLISFLPGCFFVCLFVCLFVFVDILCSREVSLPCLVRLNQVLRSNEDLKTGLN